MMKQLFQTKCPVFVLGLLAYAVTLSMGCKNPGFDSPPGYNMNMPEKMQLGKVLNEISGITYVNERGSLVAISDSKEKIFEISLSTKKLKDLARNVVPPNSDMEDIVYYGDTAYVLLSKGTIKAIPLGKADSAGITTYSLGLTGINDFESLYYDPTARGLVMICKKCAHEKGKTYSTAYRFDLETRKFDSSAFFQISHEDVTKILKNDDAKVWPAAASINPIDKRLYIISSAGNLLIIADSRGKVIEAYNLNPDRFPQAEGIAFAPNGDMYITNEGKYGKPNLLRFHYNQQQSKK